MLSLPDMSSYSNNSEPIFRTFLTLNWFSLAPLSEFSGTFCTFLSLNSFCFKVRFSLVVLLWGLGLFSWGLVPILDGISGCPKQQLSVNPTSQALSLEWCTGCFKNIGKSCTNYIIYKSAVILK